MADLVDQVLNSRRSRTTAGLKSSLAVAVALHVALLTTLVAFEGVKAEPKRPLEYVAVRAVPLQALGSPKATPARTRQPPPKPVETPSDPVAEPQPTKTPSPVKPAPPQKPSVPEGSKQADPPPTTPLAPQESAEDATAGATGSAQGLPQGTAAFGTHRLEAIDPDFTYDYYLDRMLALIHAQWQKPTTQGDVHAVVRFTVLKSGEISTLELQTASGSNAFDLAALRAVRNASPLPRLPASYRRSALDVTLIVRSD